MLYQPKSQSSSHSNDRKYTLIFDTGEEIITKLAEFVVDHGIRQGSFIVTGQVKDVTLGYFAHDNEAETDRSADTTQFHQALEIVSFSGEVGLNDSGDAHIHAHGVFKSEQTAWGGHILKAFAASHSEVVVQESSTNWLTQANQQISDEGPNQGTSS